MNRPKEYRIEKYLGARKGWSAIQFWWSKTDAQHDLDYWCKSLPTLKFRIVAIYERKEVVK